MTATPGSRAAPRTGGRRDDRHEMAAPMAATNRRVVWGFVSLVG